MASSAPSLSGIEGRVVLVTGAGVNLGRAVSLAFGGAGAKVAVNARSDAARAEEVTAAVRDLGVDAVTVMGDVADPDAVATIVAEVEGSLGPIEVLVNCVGVRSLDLAADISIETWREAMEVNCSSFFYLSRLLLPSMKERGFGRLLGIGGPVATQPGERYAAVAASKAALASCARVIALEYGKHGVTANVIQPAITTTTGAAHRDRATLERILAIPRPAELEELAFACMYLASDQGSYITGQTLRVDGGHEM